MHSIAVILSDRKKKQDLLEFYQDIQNEGGFQIFETDFDEDIEIVKIAIDKNLDFDDALHYYAAKRLDTCIISFDKDFDKTDLERFEPGEILQIQESLEDERAGRVEPIEDIL